MTPLIPTCRIFPDHQISPDPQVWHHMTPAKQGLRLGMRQPGEMIRDCEGAKTQASDGKRTVVEVLTYHSSVSINGSTCQKSWLPTQETLSMGSRANEGIFLAIIPQIEVFHVQGSSLRVCFSLLISPFLFCFLLFGLEMKQGLSQRWSHLEAVTVSSFWNALPCRYVIVRFKDGTEANKSWQLRASGYACSIFIVSECCMTKICVYYARYTNVSGNLSYLLLLGWALALPFLFLLILLCISPWQLLIA